MVLTGVVGPMVPPGPVGPRGRRMVLMVRVGPRVVRGSGWR